MTAEIKLIASMHPKEKSVPLRLAVESKEELKEKLNKTVLQLQGSMYVIADFSLKTH